MLNEIKIFYEEYKFKINVAKNYVTQATYDNGSLYGDFLAKMYSGAGYHKPPAGSWLSLFIAKPWLDADDTGSYT